MKSRIPTTEARRSTDTDIPLASASRTTDLQDIQYQPSLSGKLEKELEVQSSHKLNGWTGSEMLLAVEERQTSLNVSAESTKNRT